MQTLLLLSVVLLAAACGGAAPPPAESTPPPSDTTTTPPPAAQANPQCPADMPGDGSPCTLPGTRCSFTSTNGNEHSGPVTSSGHCECNESSSTWSCSNPPMI